MARLTMRDMIVMLLVLWIPASMFLLFRHSASVRTELRQDLLQQLRHDHQRMAPHEVHAATGLGGKAKMLQVTRAQERALSGLYPQPPLFDPDHRAVEVSDLDMVELEDAGWLDVARKLFAQNQWMLETARPPKNITLVSGIWDLGRDKIKTSAQWTLFKRPFSYYTEKLRAFLSYQFPKVLYCEERHYAEIKKMIDSVPGGPTRVIIKDKEDIKLEFRDFDILQGIRKRKDWSSRADWLASSPQAAMEYYNPMVMSKLPWTRDVARWNPFNTDAFLWIDSAHLCHNPAKITLEKEDFMLSYMDKLLITFFDYQPAREIHGFEHNAFDKYLGVAPGDRKPLKIGRGGVFGGTRPYLEVASALLDMLVSETLSNGVMGTEENIFSILYYRFPELVHFYDNKENGNCAVFDEWSRHFDAKRSGYDTRGLDCYYVVGEGAVRCFHGNVKCPNKVTPMYLTEAKGQGLCQENPGYFCTVTCMAGAPEPSWFGHPCTPTECPVKRVPESQFSRERGLEIAEKERRRKANLANDIASTGVVGDPIVVPSEMEAVPAVEEKPRILQPPPELPPPELPQSGPLAGPEVEPPPATPPTAGGAKSGRELVDAMTNDKDRDVMNKHGFDLRGLKCQWKDGVEQCYGEDDFHRELCPPHVTSVYLSLSKGQWSCQPFVEGTYCTATCQEGTERIAWSAHDEKWCAGGKDRCPKRPKVTPVDEYQLQAWDGADRQLMNCPRPAGGMPKFTVIMLAKGEVETIRNTFRTYEQYNFVESVDEFLLYLNSRSAEMDEAVAKYQQPPYNIKVMGDKENYGITYPLNWLVGNASNENILFLEKDFQLVENLDCVMDQMKIGSDMLGSGKAHVVRYRSRHLPGKPNWADISYRGKEELAFKRQPNLVCNYFHWVFNPDRRWPEQFWPCHTGEDGQSPPREVWYCSKAEFCNWTNNPSFFKKSWWQEEYEKKFPAFKSSNPYKNLEGYMNWEKHAWNDRDWVIAQGEGLFKHADVKNFGGGW